MIVLLLLLLLAVVPGCSSTSSHNESNVQAANTPATPAIAVQSAKVEVHEIQRTVDAVGSLDPNEEITVSNQVEGLVSRVFVDLGDSVKSGQTVAQRTLTDPKNWLQLNADLNGANAESSLSFPGDNNVLTNAPEAQVFLIVRYHLG